MIFLIVVKAERTGELHLCSETGDMIPQEINYRLIARLLGSLSFAFPFAIMTGLERHMLVRLRVKGRESYWDVFGAGLDRTQKISVVVMYEGRKLHL